MYNFALMSKQNKGTGRLYQKKNNVLYMGSIRILSMYELENHGLRREWWIGVSNLINRFIN